MRRDDIAIPVGEGNDLVAFAETDDLAALKTMVRPGDTKLVWVADSLTHLVPCQRHRLTEDVGVELLPLGQNGRQGRVADCAAQVADCAAQIAKHIR